MRFDYTKGKSKKYVVTAYAWNVQDHYYFHYLKDAKEMLEKLKSHQWEKGTILSITDMIKDQRKAFVRL